MLFVENYLLEFQTRNAYQGIPRFRVFDLREGWWIQLVSLIIHFLVEHRVTLDTTILLLQWL